MGTESQTVGTGELHRPIPAQLPLSTKEVHSRTKSASAPLRARDPAFEQQCPPQTVPFYAPKSPSPITQGGTIAEASNVLSNQLGSPQQVPPQLKLKPPYNNPQNTQTYGYSYGQSNVAHTATSPSGYGYDNYAHSNEEQPISDNFPSQKPNNQPFSTKEGPVTKNNPNQYMGPGGSQSATYPLHPNLGYQCTASTSAPQYKYEAQSRLDDHPQHHSLPQPHESQPQQPVPYHKSVVGNDGQKLQQQHRSRPTPDHEPNCKTEASKLKPETMASGRERPEQHAHQKPSLDQQLLPPEDHQGEDDEDLRFQNRLQNLVDDEIHQEASEVMQQVSGGRRHIVTDRQRPFDPNLVCPMCMKQFRIGEIQKFKHHVNTCDGTDDAGTVI